MPGSFGSETEDGVFAFTGSSSKSGVFGRNDATDLTPGAPAGSGVFGLTTVQDGVGVFGACNHPSNGRGVQGNGPEAGISGFSQAGVGVLAHSDHGTAMQGIAHDSAANALVASNEATVPPPAEGVPVGNGILAVTTVPGAAGVLGANNDASTGTGIQGNGPESGVSGFSDSGIGVLANSNGGDAMQGHAHSSDRNGIFGNNAATAPGPSGGPPAGNGVFGFTMVPTGSGVCGAIDGSNTSGAGVTGIGRVAGRFFGDVVVTGDIQLANADCAEDFDVAEGATIEPGTVMVLSPEGALLPSESPYDRRVAGVVAGAGSYRPGLILDRQQARSGRLPLALLGKVYCKVDASEHPVEVGDLLTTSSTAGYAMKATDPGRAFGAVIGKALGRLTSGAGLVPVLIALQ